MEKKKIIIFYNGKQEHLNNKVEYLKGNLDARKIVYHICANYYHECINLKTNNVQVIFEDSYQYLGDRNGADIFVNPPSYMTVCSDRILAIDAIPDYIARIEETFRLSNYGRGRFICTDYNGFASVTHTSMHMRINKVIFNPPATIVVWEDGSKTVVKAQDGEIYDKEKGLAMAISKRVLGDKGKYYEVFKKWTGGEDGE